MTVSDLPALNATLNATSAVLLLDRLVPDPPRPHRAQHRAVMIAAFCTSIGVPCLLPDLPRAGRLEALHRPGPIRIVYFTILLTHTILAAAIVPMVLMTLSRGLKRRDDSPPRDRALDDAAVAVCVGDGCHRLPDALPSLTGPANARVSGRVERGIMVAVSAPAALAEPVVFNPHVIAGSAALVIALLSLLVYLYRRRHFILWWVGAWALLTVSMFALSLTYGSAKLDAAAFGFSQFMGVLASLAFVVAADAYRQRPRLRRSYGLGLLPVAICLHPRFRPRWDGRVVFGPGHLLIAGGMAAAALAHLLLLRCRRACSARPSSAARCWRSPPSTSGWA